MQNVGDDTAIPLNESAPEATDSVWESHPIIEIDASEKKTRHYWEHIPLEIRNAFDDQSVSYTHLTLPTKCSV